MSLISSIELAIKNEKAEIAFYKKQAERTKNRAASTLFEILANQEEHHIELLEDVGARSVEKGTWPETIDTSATTINVAQVLDQLAFMNGSKQSDMDDIEALERAVEFEKKAEEFYLKLAGEAEDDRAELFFRTIANFERDHLIWIETFLATLKEDSVK